VSIVEGEELRLECDDGLAGQLTRDSTHADAGRLDLGLGHPLAGPVYVEGAEPGDVLQVEFVSYEPADFGVTAVIPGFGFLADLFPEPYLVKWEIQNGLARSAELPGVAVPEEMFAGVVGVAPSHELLEELRAREEEIARTGGPVADPLPESALPPAAAAGLRTIPPREIGGNIDIRQLVAGSRLLLPVSVPGALLSVGDSHATQGDGELSGTAIECSMTGTFEVILHKKADLAGTALEALDYPMLETKDEWLVHGFSFANYLTELGDKAQSDIYSKSSVDLALRDAFRKMRKFLMTTKGLTEDEAISLSSVAVDFGVTQVVDGNWGIHAIIKKSLFAGASV
jgi:acetamidase/formamidase